MNILIQDGEADYDMSFLTQNVATNYYEQLKLQLKWRQDKIFLFGRWVIQPRLVAWYADKGVNYTYSGLKMEPEIWTDTLLVLKKKIEDKTEHKFNSVLINYYRNGQDSMGWHSDNEKELGDDPTIASLSLGAKRRFRFRHKYKKGLSQALELTNGSLLVMKGKTQTYWQHTIPKTKKVLKGRINLTFRTILQ